jgi:hypothetical protein
MSLYKRIKADQNEETKDHVEKEGHSGGKLRPPDHLGIVDPVGVDWN